ncbi:MAG: AAA domain-containing protein [Bacteroidota bacterium]|nr:AAA domain-containing protein [Bacteroidota bacterium]
MPIINQAFLKILRDKLKVGNSRSIHLNVLPSTFASRLDFADLNYVKPDLAQDFLDELLSKDRFKFDISYNRNNGKDFTEEEQKRLALLSKRLNSISIENEDNYKEHGIKTFGFGYPIIAKPSRQDPSKIIKAPLFIWSLDLIRSTKKVNTWSILRNKICNERGQIKDEEIHSVEFNEVLISFLKSDEEILVPKINQELLEDAIFDKDELILETFNFFKALNVSEKNISKQILNEKFISPIGNLPDKTSMDATASSIPTIYFGGVFGLFRTQKQSIINDIDILLDNFDQFQFEDLKIENFNGTSHSSVETDPSQQEILNTLGIDPKKIIQGPPGTGKSQSLTALITNALANNLKCLVVCEKKTALDVIKKNLDEENEHLGALAAIIEDINKDRNTIVSSVRNRLDGIHDYTSSNQTIYSSTINGINKNVEEVNRQHKLLGKKIYGGKTWTQIVGEFLKRERETSYNILNKKLDLKEFEFSESELGEIIEVLKEAQAIFNIAAPVRHPLEILRKEIFEGENPRQAKKEIEEHLSFQTERIQEYLEFVESNFKELGELLFKNDALTNFQVNTMSIFSKRYKGIKKSRSDLQEKSSFIKNSHSNQRYFQHNFLSNGKKSLNHSDDFKVLYEKSKAIIDSLNTFPDFYDWKRFYQKLTSIQQKVLGSIIESDLTKWEETFECWYYYCLITQFENEFKSISKTEDLLNDIVKQKNILNTHQIKSIISNWSLKQVQSKKRLESKGRAIKSIYNLRGAPGQKRNSLRHIIDTDFDFFTDFFSVLMVSPTTCSSIVPLQEGKFDLVLFDEASQLRLEDTFTALLRGKIKIVSGDNQQMPPSSYFQGGNTLLNPTEDEIEEDEVSTTQRNNDAIELAESESLLVYAENCGYKQSHLKIHYRSQHPHLIEFSNHAFYGKRLIPMPEKENYKPIKFIEVNGLYQDQLNLDEAKKVVDILLHNIEKLENGNYPSVGVATFNLYQRNLILEEINKARLDNDHPEYREKLDALSPNLFVKNLENIQGDERDIIIISTTFGKRSDGSFRQNFGPILKRNGYKLLNVIITRAKYKIFVCCSIPNEHMSRYREFVTQNGTNGKGIFYAYLEYAKSISDGNSENRDSILQHINQYSPHKSFLINEDTFGSESPFEEEVYYLLASKVEQHRISQQYKIGGFRIDIIVRSKLTGIPAIAIECDGAKYYSSNEAYAWDMFRQKQLEQHGLKFYRIWSTKWWNSPENEFAKLVDFIQQFDRSENELK